MASILVADDTGRQAACQVPPSKEAAMAIADRYEGMHVGTCGCGAVLVWARDARGNWIMVHASTESAIYCGRATTTTRELVAN